MEINRPRVDFHVHYDPLHEETAYEAIKLAAGKNVVAMSVLARSEISDNIDKFISFGNEVGVDVIPGVEYLARIGDKSIDLICLGFDPNNKNIREYFGKDEGKRKNADIALKQKIFLEEKGFSFSDLSVDDEGILKTLLSGEISEKAINFCNIIARSNVNRGKIEKLKEEFSEEWDEVVKKFAEKPNYKDEPRKLDAKFLWSIYFAVDKKGYIPVRTHVENIIDAVHSAGGVVLYSPEGSYDPEVWSDLQRVKIDGIMAWHAGHLGASGQNRPDVPRYVVEGAMKKGMLVLGGSDFQQKDWQIGLGNGNMFISPKRYEELKSYVTLRNNGRLPWEK